MPFLLIGSPEKVQAVQEADAQESLLGSQSISTQYRASGIQDTSPARHTRLYV